MCLQDCGVWMLVQVQLSEAHAWWTGKKHFGMLKSSENNWGKNAALYLLSDTREKEKTERKIFLYVITYCDTVLGATEYFQYSEIIAVMSFDKGCTEIVQYEGNQSVVLTYVYSSGNQDCCFLKMFPHQNM